MRLRQAVLAAEPLCRVCAAAGRVTKAVEVDHIVQIADGGGDDWDNLQPICKPCHIDKTNRDNNRKVRPHIGIDGCPMGELQK